VNKISLPIDQLPTQLLAEFESNKNVFVEKNPHCAVWFSTQLEDSGFSEQLIRTWSGSRYATELCMRQPDILMRLVAGGELFRSYDDGEMKNVVTHCLSDTTNAEQLNKGLRRCRAQEMLRIIWRDLNCQSDLLETTADVSALAEVCIQQSVDFHHQQLSTEYGVPSALVEETLTEQKLLVLGMGKLGASELNLSSDIDLIFAYPERGETVDASSLAVASVKTFPYMVSDKKFTKFLDNHEFFTRLGQRVITSLDKMTEDGFVFRVDMRLRPYGESGALVLCFDAFEEYYQDQGRDWERYAMIKARVVAGDPDQGLLLLAMLRPFVYRRYIDYSVIDSLRSMKKMIMQEVKRRRLDNDVKLGPGGIRDIEFIVQSFQLIRGGRDTQLQERRLLSVLNTLAEENIFAEEAVEELKEAYHFLRNTEHVIQAFNDKQTQLLPVDDYPRQALCFSMGFDSWDSFSLALSRCRNNVSLHFRNIISDHQQEKSAKKKYDHRWSGLWAETLDDDESVGLLLEAGHENADDVIQRLKQLKNAPIASRMQAEGRDRLDRFMPMLLLAVKEAEQPSATLIRIFPLVESVLRRTAYLILLAENPGALRQLVILCAASPWVATQLARHPVLLDELLDARTLYNVPDKAHLRDELQQQMLRIPMDDLEAHMDGLRYFKQAYQLRVSAAEVTDRLELMKVSDYLTMIAEVILEHVLDVAWHFLAERHGVPQGLTGIPSGTDTDHKGFVIVGYGKLGGIELGPSSDLDLVFIYDAPANLSTNGDRPLDNSVFYTRLGQRIIHILSAQTPMGDLYEADMRLRPSGESGLLVTPLKAFEEYQHSKAWTWEHQALVRARVVAGDEDLAHSFASIRKTILGLERDETTLRADVSSMREKMRDHMLPKGLENGEQPIFHLKHGTGAIVDIEFMVQYAVLAWTHQYPALADYPDNIRILQSLQQQGLFSETQSLALTDAYKAYRSHSHRLSLLQQPNEVPMANYQQHRRAVIAKWTELMT